MSFVKLLLKVFRFMLFFLFVSVLFLAVNLFWKFIILLLLFLWSRKARWKKKDKMAMYFGVPGSGKTTFAAWYVKQCMKYGIRVFTNVPVQGAYKVERSDIGRYMIRDAVLIIDECSLEYNNRDFKNFERKQNEFYSLHRHYCVEPVLLSQGWEDADKRLRTLTQQLYYVRKSLIPGFISRKQIEKIFDIDPQTRQPIDGYRFTPFSWCWIYCPPLWKMFDSFEAPELPEKQWEKWQFGSTESTVKPEPVLQKEEGNSIGSSYAALWAAEAKSASHSQGNVDCSESTDSTLAP